MEWASPAVRITYYLDFEESRIENWKVCSSWKTPRGPAWSHVLAESSVHVYMYLREQLHIFGGRVVFKFFSNKFFKCRPAFSNPSLHCLGPKTFVFPYPNAPGSVPVIMDPPPPGLMLLQPKRYIPTPEWNLTLSDCKLVVYSIRAWDRFLSRLLRFYEWQPFWRTCVSW